MKRPILDFVEDILKAIDDIENFTKDLKLSEFKKDKRTVYAVIHAIEIMGEAVKNIPESIRANYSHIPWKQIAGMQDRLIHSWLF